MWVSHQIFFHFFLAYKNLFQWSKCSELSSCVHCYDYFVTLIFINYSAGHEIQHSVMYHGWPGCHKTLLILEMSSESCYNDKSFLFTFLLETMHLTNGLFWNFGRKLITEYQIIPSDIETHTCWGGGIFSIKLLIR